MVFFGEIDSIIVPRAVVLMELLLAKECLRELRDVVYADNLYAFGCFERLGDVARNHNATETQACRLADALLGAWRRAYLA